jgi:hypothetical protein
MDEQVAAFEQYAAPGDAACGLGDLHGPDKDSPRRGVHLVHARAVGLVLQVQRIKVADDAVLERDRQP